MYGAEVNEGKHVRSYVEVTINRGEQPYETFRSMGPSCVEPLRSEEQATIYARNNLKHHFQIEVRDDNFEDRGV